MRDFAENANEHQWRHTEERVANELSQSGCQIAAQLGTQNTSQGNWRKIWKPQRLRRLNGERVANSRITADVQDDPIARLKVPLLQPSLCLLDAALQRRTPFGGEVGSLG